MFTVSLLMTGTQASPRGGTTRGAGGFLVTRLLIIQRGSKLQL